MALVDSTDGVLMLGAYGWALADPDAKLGYNLVITAGSRLVALPVGGAEMLGLAGPLLSVPAWVAVMDAHAQEIGYAVVGGFALLWIGALGAWLVTHRRPVGGPPPLDAPLP